MSYVLISALPTAVVTEAYVTTSWYLLQTRAKTLVGCVVTCNEGIAPSSVVVHTELGSHGIELSTGWTDHQAFLEALASQADELERDEFPLSHPHRGMSLAEIDDLEAHASRW